MLLGIINFKRFVLLALSMVLSISLVTSSQGVQIINSSYVNYSNTHKSTLRNKLILSGNINLIGAGGSFPAILFQRWFGDLNTKYPRLQIDYQSIGSGAGIERFSKELVDFSASEVPLSKAEKAQIKKGALTLPITSGMYVIGYNVPQFKGELKLSRQVYVDIFLGKISKWNDPKLVKNNPNLKSVNTPITVIFRADGSGATSVLTANMSAISNEWKQKIGQGKTVNWPVGIGGSKNDGVVASIKQIEGSIGYLEYGYAKRNQIKLAAIQNKKGKYITPTPKSATVTLSKVSFPPDLQAVIIDPDGVDSYPFVTYSWLLVYQKYNNPEKAKAIEAMIEYGITQGQKNAAELDYIPLPAKAINAVSKAAQNISSEYKIGINSK